MSPGLETTVLPATIEYACEDGRTMRVERAAGATSATVSLGGNRWTLPRVESAAQEKYAQASTALYLEGDIAFIESDGRVLGGNCRSAVALPKAPTMRPYNF
ncbi:MAG: MliC family protein [Betaproteobacteria bacterium]|jgi:membrane-bound inhibitor of C-type lysozyme|nr:MliC family protein [Betaproteobacteria bacterium]MBK6805023.1 MliC family protein [Betaproteobacteria bacterium]